MAKMEIREEESRGKTVKRVVVPKVSADALKIEAYARQNQAIYSGTIYVEFVADGKPPLRTELPTERIKRHMGRFLDRQERLASVSVVAA